MTLVVEAALTYALHAPADLLFAVEAAATPDQAILDEHLSIDDVPATVAIAGEEGIGRRRWATGIGRVALAYRVTVRVTRPLVSLAGLTADPLPRLPADVVRYLWPSRYCDGVRFETWVRGRFGHFADGAKVAAIADWVRTSIAYRPGASDAATTASDTFVAREGVCRDFAHLFIALVRAADIPARMVGAYGWRVEPPDFHAVAEVWLAGGWHLVDPTGLAPLDGIVRIGVGRDATDISFLTIFGTADLVAQRVAVTRID